MAEQVRIKPEPDVASPMADDELDDAGDLEFFNTQNPEDPLGKLYLTRLPNYVWQAWDNLDDDAEIQIGTIRLWNENGKDKLQLLLKNNLAQHQRLPKEYNLDIADPDVRNTFIFTEQDLPSYAMKNKQKADAMAAGIPSHLLRQNIKPAEGEGLDRSKRRFREARRAIPKKTSIAGRVRHELHCTPVQNEETLQILSLRALEAQQPKKQIRVMSNLPPNGISSEKQFEGFIKTTEKPSKQKKMENKTARWPENQLMDKIIESFQKFTYWSMKALRAEIPQPEAFIREVLDRVAVLHRSGRFANQWALRPEFEPMVQRKGALPGSETTAPLKQDPGEESEDEDDGDVKMEDVL